MACAYCRQEHAGECSQNPVTLLRALKAAGETSRVAAGEAQLAARTAIQAAERAQATQRLALGAATAAHQIIRDTLALLAVYERTHPDGSDRRQGPGTRRNGMKDDWLRWKNPERRLQRDDRRRRA